MRQNLGGNTISHGNKDSLLNRNTNHNGIPPRLYRGDNIPNQDRIRVVDQGKNSPSYPHILTACKENNSPNNIIPIVNQWSPEPPDKQSPLFYGQLQSPSSTNHLGDQGTPCVLSPHRLPYRGANCGLNTPIGSRSGTLSELVPATGTQLAGSPSISTTPLGVSGPHECPSSRIHGDPA